MNFDKYTGARTYQAYFERYYSVSKQDINYAINVGDKVVLEISNMEFDKSVVDEQVKNNGIVDVVTSDSWVGQSSFSGETAFQKIEFTALEQGEVSITLDGVATSTHEFQGGEGKVHKYFSGKSITLNIHVYDVRNYA